VAHGLRLGIGAFLIAAFLGIWLAHGHGGMQFPGQRGLWIRVHIAMALLGWIGGVGESAFRDLAGTGTSSPRVNRPVTYGIAIALALLLWDYTGLQAIPIQTLGWLTVLAVTPLVFQSWLRQPLLGWRILATRPNGIREPIFWRSAFALAPACIFLSVAAGTAADPRWKIVLGWIALWGWGGLMAHAMLRELMARLGGAETNPRSRAALEGTNLAFALHAVSLALGVCAAITGSDLAARSTGVTMIAVALSQWASGIKSARLGRVGVRPAPV
jgi:hypothetical protein